MHNKRMTKSLGDISISCNLSMNSSEYMDLSFNNSRGQLIQEALYFY
jgi:hypothetical protein